MLSCIVLYTFIFLIMMFPVPAIDSFLEVNCAQLEADGEISCGVRCSCCCSASPQIVCVPYDWRITLVIIVIVNAAVSFSLEVCFRDITPNELLGSDLFLSTQICMH